MYCDNAPRLSREQIERARLLGVAELCDGVKAAGVHLPNDGCMDAGICPTARGMRFVGTALTVETSGGDNFPIHMAAYRPGSEGYALVIDGKGCTERAYLGDLIMAACHAVGYEAIVLDGCSRDRDGNIGLGFPVYSRGFLPRGPVKKEPGSLNTPIQCGGVRVCPGDLVAGDSDGVCVIPRNLVDTVLNEAEKKLRYEANRRLAIEEYRQAKAAGAQLPQLAPQWVLDLQAEMAKEN